MLTGSGCLAEGLSVEVIKLAIRKCKMNPEEALLMLIDESTLNDLQEEVRKKSEAINDH